MLSIPICLWVTTAIVQRHASTKQAIAQYLSNLICTSIDCNFTMQVSELTLLPLTLTCTNVQASPRTQNAPQAWQWHCNKITFHCSWMHLIAWRTLSTSLVIDQLQAQSLIDEQGLAIAPHLQKLFLGPATGIPLTIKGLKINTFDFQAHNATAHMQIMGNVSIKKSGENLKTTLYCTQGLLMHNRIELIKDLKGMFNSTIAHNEPQQLWGTLSFTAPQLPPHANQCSLSGQLHNHMITGTIKNQNQTFDLQLTADTRTHQAHAQGHLESLLAYDLFKVPTALRLIDDVLEINATINIDQLTSQGSCTLHKLPFTGTWQTNKTAYQGSLITRGVYAIPGLKNWQGVPEHCQLTIAGNFNGTHTAQLQVLTKNVITQQTVKATLSGTLAQEKFKVTGTINQFPISCIGALTPHPHIDHVTLTDGKSPIIDLQLDQKPLLTVTGTVAYEPVHQWLPEWIRSHIPGSGNLIINGTITPHQWTIQLAMHNGTIIIERLFNVITDLSAHLVIDLDHQSCTLERTHLTLQQGSLTIPYATCTYDENYIPNFVHIPLNFQHCAATILQSECVVSGGLMLCYQHNTPSMVQGSLIIDKAHIFSTLQATPSQHATHLSVPDALSSLKLAVSITNKKPLHITTPTFTGKASIACTLNNQLNNPQWTGTIKIHEGTLRMPAYALRIIAGTLYTNPNDSTDPLIDIQAQTTIENYVIRVDLTGTVNHSIIHLQTSPPLAEEQIALLLVAGSTESMLNSAAPALIMDNLAHYVTGTLFSSATGNTLWSKVFKQLKHIKLVPQFNEQANLQGISGAIEIDLSKKLKAKVQKNLMIDEQPAVELDYKLSDELSVKAFKNEQGDLGSVLQMRLRL